MASISQLKKLSLGIKWFAQGHTGREVWVLKFLNPCLVFFLSYIYYIYIFKLPLMPTMNFVDFCLVIFFLHTTLVIDHFKALTSQPSNSPWAQLFCSTLGWIGLRWASCRCVNKTSSTYFLAAEVSEMAKSAAGSSTCYSEMLQSTCAGILRSARNRSAWDTLCSQIQSKEGQMQTVLQRRVTPMPKPEDPRKGFLAEMTQHGRIAVRGKGV